MELNDFDIQTKKYKSRTVMFLSRFISDSFKRSFSTDSCDSSFVYHLDTSEKKQLDTFIENNPDLLKKFNSYKPKALDAIYNENVNIPTSNNSEELNNELSSFQNLTLEQIYNRLLETQIGSWNAKGLTAQFVSKNHETHEGKLKFSFSKILTF
ncbi:MAG: hypothetical protein ACFHVJ_18745 [Aestuariibacter sp.]